MELGQKWHSHSLTDSVLLTGQTMLIQGIDQVGQFDSLTRVSKSILADTVIFEDVIMGVIVLESRSADAFNYATANLLEQMANRASVALQHAQLFKRLIQQREVETRLRTLFQKFVSEEVAAALEDENALT